VTDSATFTTPEAGDEETGEDLGGLDDLLASLILPQMPNTTWFGQEQLPLKESVPLHQR